MNLNNAQFVVWRSRMTRIVEPAAVHDPQLFRSLMSYPDALPGLSTLKPPA